MVVSASVASVRMRREFGDIETASCLLLCATRMHRVHHVQCGAAGVNGLLIAAQPVVVLDARRSAAAPKGCCACHAVLCQLLNKSKWCSQLWCSDSGFDAGRLAIAGTDSNCS